MVHESFLTDKSVSIETIVLSMLEVSMTEQDLLYRNGVELLLARAGAAYQHCAATEGSNTEWVVAY